jgi:hypothetical protein
MWKKSVKERGMGKGLHWRPLRPRIGNQRSNLDRRRRRRAAAACCNFFEK